LDGSDLDAQQVVNVLKLDLDGKVTWRYQGELLEYDGSRLRLQAYFDREDMLFHGMLFRRGDLFIETWYTDRWYNIFEIHAREDGRLRGWYCNIGYPAKWEDSTLSYVDLALDLLVFPDGKQLVLDQDEFAALNLSIQDRQQALAALDELRHEFTPAG
jgi:hypothetical protein